MTTVNTCIDASESVIAAVTDTKQVQQQEAQTSEGHGVTLWLVVAVVTCLLGSCFPAGYCIGVINTPQEIIRTWLRESLLVQYGTVLSGKQEVVLWAVVVSLFVGGAILGASLGPLLADRAGRRTSLLLNHLLSGASALLLLGCRAAGSVEMLILGRFTSGLFAGVATWLVPLYLCEVGPCELRSVMGVILPLGLCFGLVMSQILGMDTLLGTVDGWPYLLGGFLVLVLGALVLHPSLPESPTYCFLVACDQNKGHIELQRLRGRDSKQAEAEESALKELARGGGAEQTKQTWGVLDVMRKQEYRLPLLITVLLNAGQQFSGINAVFYYSTLIFRGAGLDQSQSQAAAIGSGTINFFMAALAIPLIKYCRRRVLMMWSVMLSVLCQVSLIVALHLTSNNFWASYLAITCLMAYIVTYELGLGPVPYMIATELFPGGPLSVGISLGGTANWSTNLMVGLTFPVVQEYLGEFSFLFFILSSCLLGIFIYKFLPETLGKNSASSLASDQERISKDEGSTDVLRDTNKPVLV